MTDQNSRVKPICSVCTSDDIVGDAPVRWSEPEQKWEMSDDVPYDKTHYCGNCENPTRVKWVEINEDSSNNDTVE